MAKVSYSERSFKDLARIPKVQQKRISSKINLLTDFPLLGKPLVGEYSGTRSLRSWPYRIIYVFNPKEKLVCIVRILHRQGAYN